MPHANVLIVSLVLLYSASHFSLAQTDSPQIKYLLQLTNEKKDKGHYFGTGEEIVFGIHSDKKKRKHYTGEITAITDSTISINDSTIALNDLSMIMSKGYRNARHKQWGMTLLAGSILTASGTALLLSGSQGNGEMIIGVAGVLIGVPLLIKSIKAYFVSNRYYLRKGWKLHVMHIQVTSPAD